VEAARIKFEGAKETREQVRKIAELEWQLGRGRCGLHRNERPRGSPHRNPGHQQCRACDGADHLDEDAMASGEAGLRHGGDDGDNGADDGDRTDPSPCRARNADANPISPGHHQHHARDDVDRLGDDAMAALEDFIRMSLDGRFDCTDDGDRADTCTRDAAVDPVIPDHHQNRARNDDDNLGDDAKTTVEAGRSIDVDNGSDGEDGGARARPSPRPLSGARDDSARVSFKLCTILFELVMSATMWCRDDVVLSASSV